MQPFLFVFKVTPSPQNPGSDKIGGAEVHIYVFADTINIATDRATRYLNDQHWQIKEDLYAVELTPQHISELDTVSAAHYQKAEQQGIAALFHAWPK